LPAAWQHLPSLALPDGAHNVDHGLNYPSLVSCFVSFFSTVEKKRLKLLKCVNNSHVIYFLLPSLDNPNRSVFGISCYRQILAKDLLNKSTDVTRSTVQKSVCVLSRIPLFGVLTAKLQLITEVYFNERDFAKVCYFALLISL
uniref:UDENN domain-containing protein n=1 Tax=Gongylonema pulchrum TaxID=637853 RepID=A0A183EI83_9BILA